MRRSLSYGHVRVTIHITDTSAVTASAPVTLVAFGNRPRTAIAAAAHSRIAVFGHTAFVLPSGIAEVFLRCFDRQNCTGTITLTTITSCHGTLASATNGTLVHIPLNAQGRKLTTNHAIKINITVRNNGGPTATSTLTLEHFH